MQSRRTGASWTRWAVLYKISLYVTGEPLIHRAIYDMIRYATERRVGTVISTNFHRFVPSARTR